MVLTCVRLVLVNHLNVGLDVEERESYENAEEERKKGEMSLLLLPSLHFCVIFAADFKNFGRPTTTLVVGIWGRSRI